MASRVWQRKRKAEDLSLRMWPEHRPSGPVTAKRGLERRAAQIQLQVKLGDWPYRLNVRFSKKRISVGDL
jgi:hypothetical protein